MEQHIHYAETVVDRALIMNEGLIRAEVPGSRMSGPGSRHREDLPRAGSTWHWEFHPTRTTK